MGEVLSYGKQWIDDDDLEAVQAVLRSDFLTQGPAIERFEAKLCAITGAKYCVAVANATAGLHMAVASLELPAGSEGVTSPITFVASPNSMAYCGVKPVFADIDPRTYCLDAADLERRLTPMTRVVIPVHFAGQTADMPAIGALAKRRGLAIIEDAAHAIGTVAPGGEQVGDCTHSAMTVFSFHPVKTITTGEGGAVTTNDPKLYDHLKRLRSHGIIRDSASMAQNPGPWYHEMVSLGFNYRMTDLQAALGTSQLGKLDAFKAARRRIVDRYNEAFAACPFLVTPYETPGSDACFHLYVLKIDFQAIGLSRAEVMKRLLKAGVGTQVHYIPVHTQPYYQKTYGYRPGDYPVAEAYYEQALSIPLYPRMSGEDVELVIRAVLGLAR